MRMEREADDMRRMKAPREKNSPDYLVVILLSRVISRLNGVQAITPGTIERLFSADLAYLQNLYNEINQVEKSATAVVCPQCQHGFELEQPGLGGSQAIPSTSFTGR